MKTQLTLLLAWTALSGCASTTPAAPGTSSGSSSASSTAGSAYVIDPGDRAAVLAALQDYVDGFTLGRPELLERSLSANLVKKGYRRAEPGEPFGDALPLSYEDALALAARRGESSASVDSSRSSVEIFEVADKTAAGKVTAFWGIDYVHLVKEDGRWRIHHVIWQTEPERATR